MASPADALQEQALWIALSQIHGLGSQTFCKLLQTFGSPEQIYATSFNQLREVVPEAIALEIKAGANLENIQATLEWLTQDNNHLITLADTHYPAALLEIPDPPPILYAKGNLDCLKMPCIAVVGSRNASPQGEKNAEDFSQALAQHHYCIVSGMALGIDGAAHRGALKAKGATIAVVGTGLDIVYPARHRELAHKIVTQGLILSEFSLGTPSRAQNFPKRNRIISGLSLGCLVVEANTQSGSLITARLATEQGREVFAIPGSIHSPLAKGCHDLIKQGAKLVDSIHDILNEFDYSSSHFDIEDMDANPDESNHILDLMGFDPITIETLIERSRLTSEQLSAMLLILELESKVASLAGGRFQRLV